MQQPDMFPVPEQGLWCNKKDFEVFIRGVKIVVPGLFLIDGASIPRFLWAVTYHPFDTKIILAALVHDWLYWNHQVSKYEADLIFKELAIMNGVSEDMADVMHHAIATFGQSSWSLKEEDKPLLQLLYIMIKDSARFSEYHFPMEALTL